MRAIVRRMDASEHEHPDVEPDELVQDELELEDVDPEEMVPVPPEGDEAEYLRRLEEHEVVPLESDEAEE